MVSQPDTRTERELGHASSCILGQDAQKRKVKKVWLRGLRPEFSTPELDKGERGFEECVQMAVEQEHRMGGLNGPSSVQADLLRGVQELHCNFQRMQGRSSQDGPEPGYRHYAADSRSDPVYSQEEVDLVANVQTTPWPSAVPPPGPMNWNVQAMPPTSN